MHSQANGGAFMEEKQLNFWSTQIFHAIFYIYFHLKIIVWILVCLAALTLDRPTQHQETLYLAETVPAHLRDPFLWSDKQRTTFVDTQLPPLVSKTQLKCVLWSSRTVIRCFVEMSQRKSVTKPRTEVLFPKSQPGTLTGKFLVVFKNSLGKGNRNSLVSFTAGYTCGQIPLHVIVTFGVKSQET